MEIFDAGCLTVAGPAAAPLVLLLLKNVLLGSWLSSGGLDPFDRWKMTEKIVAAGEVSVAGPTGSPLLVLFPKSFPYPRSCSSVDSFQFPWEFSWF